MNGEFKCFYYGVDVVVFIGMFVIVLVGGKIMFVFDFYFEGNVLFFDYGNGLISIFMYMFCFDVVLGDFVD